MSTDLQYIRDVFPIVGTVSGDILSGGKPHPKSYRPDLPTCPQIRVDSGRGAHATPSLIAWADSIVRKASNAIVAPAPKSDISANKAHAKSYRPDLPLRGCDGGASVATLTKADRAYYAARPIELRPTRALHGKMSSEALLEKARTRLSELKISVVEG